MCVTILELTCTRHLLYTFEIKSTLIPSGFLFVQTSHGGCHQLLTYFHNRMNSTLILEILHGSGFCLDDNKIHTGAYFITLGEMYITRTISADITLKHRVHSYFLNIGKECNSIVNIIDENLFVKVS